MYRIFPPNWHQPIDAPRNSVAIHGNIRKDADAETQHRRGHEADTDKGIWPIKSYRRNREEATAAYEGRSDLL
jgi:hypothetical protein